MKDNLGKTLFVGAIICVVICSPLILGAIVAQQRIRANSAKIETLHLGERFNPDGFYIVRKRIAPDGSFKTYQRGGILSHTIIVITTKNDTIVEITKK